jgi:hypothetical protein
MTSGFNAPRHCVTALLGSCALVAAGAATAQPRREHSVPGSMGAALPVTDTEAIGEWLRRLVGTFKYEGMIGICPNDCEPIKGSSDCTGIGEGPGVQCILNVTWADHYKTDPYKVDTEANNDNYMISYLDPAMELFGLDPMNSAISHLVVNNKGLPEGGLGFIKGNTASFKAPCVNARAGCYRVVVIEAKPDSEVLWMWFGKVDHMASGMFDFYATMTVRRVQPDVRKDARSSGSSP